MCPSNPLNVMAPRVPGYLVGFGGQHPIMIFCLSLNANYSNLRQTLARHKVVNSESQERQQNSASYPTQIDRSLFSLQCRDPDYFEYDQRFFFLDDVIELEGK